MKQYMRILRRKANNFEQDDTNEKDDDYLDYYILKIE